MKISWVRISVCVAALVLGALAALAQSAYFPAKAFDSDTRSDRFMAHWFSGQLSALEEPSLLAMSKDKSLQSYRFLWLRTFHHPVAVRVDIRSDGSATLTTKIADGAGGYEPGKLTTNTSRLLSQQETAGMLAAIKDSGFWPLSGPIPRDPGSFGTDGSEWCIEGVNDGTYHMVTRWSPKNGAIYTLGRYFLFDLGRLKIAKDEFY